MSGFVEEFRMKLFIKILLFVFTTFVTNVVVANAFTSVDFQQSTISNSFHTQIAKREFKFPKNDLANCCQNGQDLVSY